MEITVEERPPVVRCYECGSSQVSALCHHCWRPGCAKHVLPSPLWAERLFGREGGGPGMQNARARHCGDCAHAQAGTAGATRRWLAVGVAGTGLAVIGLIVVWLSFIAGADLPPGRRTIRRSRLSACPPRRGRGRAAMPVPLYPKVTDVELVEELRGEITLGSHGGDYQTVLNRSRAQSACPSPSASPIATGCGVGRSACVHEDPEMRYCAGRLVLQGPFGIKEGEQVSGPVLALDGDARDYPVFRCRGPAFVQPVELRPELQAAR